MVPMVAPGPAVRTAPSRSALDVGLDLPLLGEARELCLLAPNYGPDGPFPVSGLPGLPWLLEMDEFGRRDVVARRPPGTPNT